MGGMAITPDNTIMALAEDFLSRRQYGIRFRNLETGNWYPELLDNVEPSFVWANDSWTFYYVRKHPVTLLPYQVWRHAIGTPASQDKLIYEEKDDTFYVSLHKTTSKHYVVIHLASATTSEVRLLDAELADAEPFVFCRGVKITNTVSIIISTAFIYALTVTAKTLVYIVPECVKSSSGKS